MTDDSLTLEILTAMAEGLCIQCGAEADEGLFCDPCRRFLNERKPSPALVRLREALEEGAHRG